MKFYEDPVCIDMCRKAVELQDSMSGCIPQMLQSPLLRGEIFFAQNNVFHRDERGCLCKIFRQDQLQEMMDEPLGWLQLINNFNEYCLMESYNTTMNYTYLEQLWLAFVMKELHNKTWTGSDWE